MSAEKTVQLVEVVLTGEHIHKGVPKQKGDKIEVTERQKAFLQQAGKVDLATSTAIKGA
ncbi:hypothetical protein LNN38_21345 [Pseudomonas sp. LA21]|uniref:DUF7210 family protein n=1 Tax=Pseudomonas sp. LA21 TaxID=2893373 RepID=UPI001FB7A8FB|nr:hypothetical protein [Pseudomonas sp. LA21]MCJ1887420.1 hypothetical protein [Pseudomonas sp. LA21]